MITLDLPPHVEQQLIKTANDKGITVEQFIADMVAKSSNHGEMMLNTPNTNFLLMN